MLILLYHILEHLDGERGVKLMPYGTAQRLKWKLLTRM